MIVKLKSFIAEDKTTAYVMIATALAVLVILSLAIYMMVTYTGAPSEGITYCTPVTVGQVTYMQCY